ncbi:MAG: transposase [Sandaracinaceae bacterium]
MMERCRKLERGILGQQKSERRTKDEAQLALGVLQMMLGEREAAAIDELPVEQEVKAHKRRKHPGRRPLPDELPHVDIEVLPDEVQREGLDAFERIGEEVTLVLERRPASMVVVRITKPKFVRRDRDKDQPTEVHVGSTPPIPIERGVAGPGMLADTIVRRWQDHLPLHRLEDVYARDGVEIARSTMCSWHGQLAPMVEPVVSAMREDAFGSPYLVVRRRVAGLAGRHPASRRRALRAQPARGSTALPERLPSSARQ